MNIYRHRKSEKSFKIKQKNDGECDGIEESKEKENGFEISSPFSRFPWFSAFSPSSFLSILT